MAKKQHINGLGYKSVLVHKEEPLGVGSYGSVFKATCDDLVCAAKIVHPTLVTGVEEETSLRPELRHRLPIKRFETECEFLKDIQHPNIIQYLGMYIDYDTGLPILLMELMDESLTHFLAHEPPNGISLALQLSICSDVACALSFLHTNDIVHRDLSSNNILMIAKSRVKLTDFGMAKFVTVHGSQLSNTICPGTDAYMPPEAFDNATKYTDRGDIFSVGVNMIQILSQKFPSPGDRFKTLHIDHPQIPQGSIEVRVTEIERRLNHIDTVESSSPLLPIALECLKDKPEKRPRACDLCQMFRSLKRELEKKPITLESNTLENKLQENTVYEPQYQNLLPTTQPLYENLIHKDILVEKLQLESEAKDKKLAYLYQELEKAKKLIEQKNNQIAKIQQAERTNEMLILEYQETIGNFKQKVTAPHAVELDNAKHIKLTKTRTPPAVPPKPQREVTKQRVEMRRSAPQLTFRTYTNTVPSIQLEFPGNGSIVAETETSQRHATPVIQKVSLAKQIHVSSSPTLSPTSLTNREQLCATEIEQAERLSNSQEQAKDRSQVAATIAVPNHSATHYRQAPKEQHSFKNETSVTLPRREPQAPYPQIQATKQKLEKKKTCTEGQPIVYRKRPVQELKLTRQVDAAVRVKPNKSPEVSRKPIRHENLNDPQDIPIKTTPSSLLSPILKPELQFSNQTGSVSLSWRRGKNAPVVMSRDTDAVVNGGMVYLRPHRTRKIYSYNSTANLWSKQNDCLTDNTTLAIVEGSLITVGGTCSKKLFTLSQSSDEKIWTEKYPSMMTERSRCTAVSYSSALIVMGGMIPVSSGTQVLQTIEVLNIDERQWTTTVVDLPQAIYASLSQIINSHIYLLGGFDKTLNETKRVYSCSLVDLLVQCSSSNFLSKLKLSRKYSTLWTAVEDLPVSGATCTSIHNTLIAIGGKDSNGIPTNEVYEYNKATNSWQEIEPLSNARSNCFATTLCYDTLFVVGGIAPPTKFGNISIESVELANSSV